MTTKNLMISSTAGLIAAAAFFASSACPAPVSAPQNASNSSAFAAACESKHTLLAGHAASLSLVQTRGHVRDVSPAYGWPVKPFDRQHPLRGFLDDPRIAKHSQAFHFGVDVAAPDGTAVYAVAGGEIFFGSAQAVAVKTGPNHEFGYWHIIPAVKDRQIVRTHDLLGHIAPGWGHVHFAERIGGVYVNPTRPGGLGPYTDPVPPAVDEIELISRPDASIDIVASAHDTTWPPVGGGWQNEPVTPALLRWRIVQDGKHPGAWTTAADFRSRMLDASLFDKIYAQGTAQNHKGIDGAYCFNITRAWKPTDDAYTIEVAATDTRGNTGVASLPLTVSLGKIRASTPLS